MSIKPILFNTEMVRAILEGRKTETRRKIKLQPTVPCEIRLRKEGPLQGKWQMYREDQTVAKDTSGPWSWVFEPPFQAGDVLWVRETWTEINGVYAYRADDEMPEGWHLTAWRPSIFMPKEAARLFLRVVDVQAQKLSDIMVVRRLTNEGFERISDFAKLWDDTLKPSDRDTYGWDADPWVWAITFERCEKPKGWPE
jgi:hypothetical protein